MAAVRQAFHRRTPHQSTFARRAPLVDLPTTYSVTAKRKKAARFIRAVLPSKLQAKDTRNSEKTTTNQRRRRTGSIGHLKVESLIRVATAAKSLPAPSSN